MYERFYGLAEPPFSLTPNPRFLFLTERHREALAQLLYGVQAKKGFIVLTGEAGTGKTTLLNALRRRLDDQTAVAFVFNSTLSFDDLLEYVLEDLDAPTSGSTRGQRLMALNAFLTERRRAGHNTVLVLDEAQNFGHATLEQVRLLSNFETATEKLLQIVLVGQPELGARLDLPELRQLKQRIALRCHIAPLAPDEVADYIALRLRIAGGRGPQLFAPAAVRRIADYSGGIPRLVNTLCDHCLVFGYAEHLRRIDADVVAQAIRALEDGAGGDRRPRARAGWLTALRPWRHGLRVGLVAAAVGVTTLVIPESVRLAIAELARSVRHMVLP
jgi:general secretion pathway protein A